MRFGLNPLQQEIEQTAQSQDSCVQYGLLFVRRLPSRVPLLYSLFSTMLYAGRMLLGAYKIPPQKAIGTPELPETQTELFSALRLLSTKGICFGSDVYITSTDKTLPNGLGCWQLH